MPYNKFISGESLKNRLDKHPDRNYVYSYPAGTGKTTAIVNCICKSIKDGENKRFIYISPTCSLLDELYDNIINTGIDKNLIFKYYYKSEDENQVRKNAIFYGNSLDNEINTRLLNSKVVLITHKRMLFETASRFINIRFTKSTRYIVFIDEAVQPIITATIFKHDLNAILSAVGFIEANKTPQDYLDKIKLDIKPDSVINRTSLLHTMFMKEICYTPRQPRVPKPSYWHFELSDNNTGFESREYTSAIKDRLDNLYFLLAQQIAKGEFTTGDNESTIYIHIPVALQLAWLDYAQVVVMDATADVSPSLYPSYKILSKPELWNFDKLNLTVYHSHELSKSKIKDHPDIINSVLDNINLNKYNQIYIVSNKSFLNQINDYLISKYPDYKIIYEISDKKAIISEYDDVSDEVYKDYTSVDKVIFLTNYGRTRGSNLFRNCDCVVQIGAFRLPPKVIELTKIIYKEISDNELCIANFIQELYRGKIRCDKSMDSYAIIDTHLYTGLISTYPKLEKYIKLGDLNTLNRFVLDTYVNRDAYGIYAKIISNLYSYQKNKQIINKEDLFKIFDNTRLDKIRTSLLRIYNKYSDLRELLFFNYKTSEELSSTLTLYSKSYNIELILFKKD